MMQQSNLSPFVFKNAVFTKCLYLEFKLFIKYYIPHGQRKIMYRLLFLNKTCLHLYLRFFLQYIKKAFPKVGLIKDLFPN